MKAMKATTVMKSRRGHLLLKTMKAMKAMKTIKSATAMKSRSGRRVGVSRTGEWAKQRQAVVDAAVEEEQIRGELAVEAAVRGRKGGGRRH